MIRKYIAFLLATLLLTATSFGSQGSKKRIEDDIYPAKRVAVNVGSDSDLSSDDDITEEDSSDGTSLSKESDFSQFDTEARNQESHPFYGKICDKINEMSYQQCRDLIKHYVKKNPIHAHCYLKKDLRGKKIYLIEISWKYAEERKFIFSDKDPELFRDIEEELRGASLEDASSSSDTESEHDTSKDEDQEISSNSFSWLQKGSIAALVSAGIASTLWYAMKKSLRTAEQDRKIEK